MAGERGRVARETAFGAATAAFAGHLRMRNYSEATICIRGNALRQFVAWCDERSLTDVGEITRPILERYRHHLYMRRRKDGRPLSFSFQASHLVSLKQFFAWLTRSGRIAANPASELELPRLEVRIPRDVLSAEEAELVLRQPNLLDPCGLRDRAMLEVFYSTAMRRAELCGLTVWDVDARRGTVFIRLGKGSRDRVVPIGERALHWVERYIREVRPLILVDVAEDHLFLSLHGEPLIKDSVSGLVGDYITAAGLGKKGGCHLFRHTCATLMLEGGADIRFIQEMLGHKSLESTQVYTRVAIGKLQQVHRATHPAALLDALDEATDEPAEVAG
jgi:integrase/recombinase XerD